MHAWSQPTCAASSSAVRNASLDGVMYMVGRAPSVHSMAIHCGWSMNLTSAATCARCRRSATSYVSLRRSSRAAEVRTKRRLVPCAALLTPSPCTIGCTVQLWTAHQFLVMSLLAPLQLFPCLDLQALTHLSPAPQLHLPAELGTVVKGPSSVGYLQTCLVSASSRCLHGTI